jgi:hypothetical protein
VAAARYELTFLRNQLVFLLQTSDPIFELAALTLRKQVDYPVSTAKGILARIAGPIVHGLADLELMERHSSPHLGWPR